MQWKIYSVILAAVVLVILYFNLTYKPEEAIQVTHTDTSFHKAEIDDNTNGDTLVGKEAVSAPNYTPDGGNGADTAHAEHILSFAKMLIDVPYKYASANPKEGFDCSGFLYYVMENFNIDVPRSSKDYMNFGTTIPFSDAKPADFILFTGTDSTERLPGHVGLILNNEKGRIEFIHSSSGKSNGVTISPLEGYYSTRFIKVIRILRNNG